MISFISSLEVPTLEFVQGSLLATVDPGSADDADPAPSDRPRGLVAE